MESKMSGYSMYRGCAVGKGKKLRKNKKGGDFQR